MISLSLRTAHSMSYQTFHAMKESAQATKALKISNEIIEGLFTVFRMKDMFYDINWSYLS